MLEAVRSDDGGGEATTPTRPTNEKVSVSTFVISNRRKNKECERLGTPAAMLSLGLLEKRWLRE